jgi:proteic killer suppression protein
MIQSFRCKHTRSLFEGGNPSRFRAFKDTAIRKLTQLDAAQTLEFLRSLPGKRIVIVVVHSNFYSFHRSLIEWA